MILFITLHARKVTTEELKQLQLTAFVRPIKLLFSGPKMTIFFYWRYFKRSEEKTSQVSSFHGETNMGPFVI